MTKKLRLALLGPPGVGKGTQARRLADAYGLTHFSTGDRLARAIADGTPFGAKVKDYVDRGELVPDPDLMAFVREELRKVPGGYVLDGFPRTLGQAQALAETEPLDAVFYLQADNEVIVERAATRLVCRCGRSYGPDVPPRVSGVCDACGKPLYRRGDDEPSVVARRLEEYNNKTRPLLHHYRGVLKPVNANALPDQIQEALLKVVEGIAKP